MDRADVVRRSLKHHTLFSLASTRSGEPGHPLYLPHDRALSPYRVHAPEWK
jgi:hypothetical protein